MVSSRVSISVFVRTLIILTVLTLNDYSVQNWKEEIALSRICHANDFPYSRHYSVELQTVKLYTITVNVQLFSSWLVTGTHLQNSVKKLVNADTPASQPLLSVSKFCPQSEPTTHSRAY